MIVLCKKILVYLLIFCYLFSITAYAKADTVSAKHCIAIDSKTKTVLYEKDAYSVASMASTTKIMTCLIACLEGDMDEIVSITNDMLYGTEGSLLYLKVNDKISLHDLVIGAMLASGNDAANAIGIAISGSIEEFVLLMNSYASKFEMNSTSFETVCGLDGEKHYSTAYDMAILASYAMENELFRSICKMQNAKISINGNEQTVYNHNKLLSIDECCIGIKTGFTEKSGRCLVSAFDFKGNTIIIVTLNAPDDWDDHAKILEFSKKKYRLSCKSEYFDINTVGAEYNIIQCVASYDISYLSDYETKAFYYPLIYAPTISNSKIGILKIYSKNVCIGTVDIIVPESVKVWQTTK